MSDFQDFLTQIAEFENRQDWSPALVTSFVRQAEAKLNQELRVSRMIETVTTDPLFDRSTALPDDWLEMDFVSVANPNATNGWLPIRYKSRDEFFNLVDQYAIYYYTIEGRTITFGGTPDAVNGIQYQFSYYGEVPVFSDTNPSWVYTKYPSLYLNAAQMHARLHAVGEEQNAANMKTLAEDTIQKLNAEHLRSKASGSRLTRSRIRSFG